MQGGNNNTYCHDSELNWFNWDQATQDETGYARFFRHLINLRSVTATAAEPVAPSLALCVALILTRQLYTQQALHKYVLRFVCACVASSITSKQSIDEAAQAFASLNDSLALSVDAVSIIKWPAAKAELHSPDLAYSPTDMDRSKKVKSTPLGVITGPYMSRSSLGQPQ